MSEYKVITEEVTNIVKRDVQAAAERLAREVNLELASGWQLQGGVAAVQAGTSVYLIQALSKC